MALGNTLTLPVNFRGSKDGQVAPCSLSSNWITVIDSAGVATQDASAITNPDTQITRAAVHIIRRENHAGTTLTLRMAYTGTPNAVPSLAVFGRSGSDGWQRLKSKSGANAAVLTHAASSDVTDGTLKYTEVTDAQRFDCDGCDEFLIGVETAYSVSAGSTTGTLVQAKMV
jgi:hypothetical protein